MYYQCSLFRNARNYCFSLTYLKQILIIIRHYLMQRDQLSAMNPPESENSLRYRCDIIHLQKKNKQESRQLIEKMTLLIS